MADDPTPPVTRSLDEVIGVLMKTTAVLIQEVDRLGQGDPNLSEGLEKILAAYKAEKAPDSLSVQLSTLYASIVKAKGSVK